MGEGVALLGCHLLRILQDSTICDGYWQVWGIFHLLGDLLDREAHLVSVDHSAEDGVFAVQVRARDVAHKELAAVCVGPSVRHRQQTLVSMLDPNAFVLKLLAVDALVARAIRVHNLAALHHEVRNHSLDHSTFVIKILTHLSRA